MKKNQFLKVKNSLLELENIFIEIKDKKLKDRKVKIKREIVELFIKPIITTKDDMNKFEQKEVKKIRPSKNTCYNWLINYVSDKKKKEKVQVVLKIGF